MQFGATMLFTNYEALAKALDERGPEGCRADPLVPNVGATCPRGMNGRLNIQRSSASVPISVSGTQNSALTTLCAQLFLTANWSVLAKFDGEFANGSQTYAGSGTLRYTW
jgi:hypothetical protein